jgi:UPF0716 protein FxsA
VGRRYPAFMRRFLELTVAAAVVEILVIVAVAEVIGVVNTIGLLILTSVLGGLILKAQGVAALRRVIADVHAERVPGPGLADGALRVTAGILLAVPGFVSDIPGLALLVRPVRDRARRWIRRRWLDRGFVIVRGDELEA